MCNTVSCSTRLHSCRSMRSRGDHDDIIVKGASINSLGALTGKYRPLRCQMTEAGDCLAGFTGLPCRNFRGRSDRPVSCARP